jgi:hypothetical protein
MIMVMIEIVHYNIWVNIFTRLFILHLATVNLFIYTDNNIGILSVEL